ncbi:uncharacterized protein IWZ02DRAFT_512182 [Phyllosticta citriasiana]|uniref:uncharacterized protein n=1 Tax=Phyllosticta citriasiana TaxID=595635 RepID=UPI0030FDA83C
MTPQPRTAISRYYYPGSTANPNNANASSSTSPAAPSANRSATRPPRPSRLLMPFRGRKAEEPKERAGADGDANAYAIEAPFQSGDSGNSGSGNGNGGKRKRSTSRESVVRALATKTVLVLEAAQALEALKAAGRQEEAEPARSFGQGEARMLQARALREQDRERERVRARRRLCGAARLSALCRMPAPMCGMGDEEAGLRVDGEDEGDGDDEDEDDDDDDDDDYGGEGKCGMCKRERKKKEEEEKEKEEKKREEEKKEAKGEPDKKENKKPKGFLQRGGARSQRSNPNAPHPPPCRSIYKDLFKNNDNDDVNDNGNGNENDSVDANAQRPSLPAPASPTVDGRSTLLPLRNADASTQQRSPQSTDDLPSLWGLIVSNGGGRPWYRTPPAPSRPPPPPPELLMPQETTTTTTMTTTTMTTGNPDRTEIVTRHYPRPLPDDDATLLSPSSPLPPTSASAAPSMPVLLATATQDTTPRERKQDHASTATNATTTSPLHGPDRRRTYMLRSSRSSAPAPPSPPPNEPLPALPDWMLGLFDVSGAGVQRDGDAFDPLERLLWVAEVEEHDGDEDL